MDYQKWTKRLVIAASVVEIVNAILALYLSRKR